MVEKHNEPAPITPEQLKALQRGDGYNLIELLLFVVAGLSIIAVASYAGAKALTLYFPTHNLANSSPEHFKDLSPALRACYSSGPAIMPFVISGVFGAAIGFLYLFGLSLYNRFWRSLTREREEFFSSIAHHIRTYEKIEVTEVLGAYHEQQKSVLDRRNHFWGVFVRVTLAILVVVAITMLISVCKIEAQAGLPIITGIIAFIIGQGSDGGSSQGAPIVFKTVVQETRPQEPTDSRSTATRPNGTPSSS